MKNEHKDINYYRRRCNFYRLINYSALIGMALFAIFSIAGWCEYHNARGTANARMEIIRLGSRKIDSLTVKADYYQDWYVHHYDDCVEGKVLTDYELSIIKRIKKR